MVHHRPTTRVVFITGTDTGVGKTLLTALLLRHLREKGFHSWALKPFCSGDRGDALLLHKLAEGELTLDEINPFYFPEPVAPLVSARRHRRNIRLEDAVNHIERIAARLGFKQRRGGHNLHGNSTESVLLVEGVGGLLVPLGEGFTVIDFAACLDCEMILVSQNRLGTINHTLLSVESLRQHRRKRCNAHVRALEIVLMETSKTDASSASNAAIIRELAAPIAVFPFPFLGSGAKTAGTIKNRAREQVHVLKRIISGETKSVNAGVGGTAPDAISKKLIVKNSLILPG